MKTYENKPLVPSTETPREIIGHENLTLFTQFIKFTSASRDGSFPESAVSSKFGDDVREGMATILQELRDKGFYPDGIGADGKVKWMMATKSAVHDYMDNLHPEYDNMSQAELGAIARRGYRKLTA